MATRGHAVMPARAADWIAAHALTPRYITGQGGLDLVRMCACQYGPCGHCAQLGRHDRCTTKVGFNGRPPLSPAARLNGIPVWTPGKPCAWRCPCDCPAPTPEPVALEARADAPTQLSLFDLAAGGGR